jgi:hypothetical protein
MIHLGPIVIAKKKSLDEYIKKQKDESLKIASLQIMSLAKENHHLRTLINSDKHLLKLMKKTGVQNGQR